MNDLKSHLRIIIEALLRSGVGLLEVELHTGVDRKTIRSYASVAHSSEVATGSDRDDVHTPHPGHRLSITSSPARTVRRRPRRANRTARGSRSRWRSGATR